MKRFRCVVFLSFLCVSAMAQTSLCVSTNKTTSLIFPFAIKHVDRGSGAILAQQVKDMPAILLVKAGTKGFTETNLSVITEDGSVYAFDVCYDEKPAKWVYQLPTQAKGSTSMYANSILSSPQFIKGVKDEKWDVLAQLKGIYIKEDVLYFQLSLTNNSSLHFTINHLRFYISDKKTPKRTAVQEIELTPLHVSGNVLEVKANSTSTVVVALEKFTIPDAKYLGIQIMEKNGGRQLFMKARNKKVMQAKLLPDLK